MASTTRHDEDPVLLSDRRELRSWRASRRASGRSVAFVPTMGGLHEGHLGLVDEAKRFADDVLVSIFVNPAQFAAHEDLDRYPRTLQDDMAMLRKRGAAAVFSPTAKEMYPNGSPGGTVVVPRFVQGKSEDSSRPHFFTGVATVCLKLFNMCQPDVVVLGQKDAMQCAVIKRMISDLCLDLDVKIVIAPTCRESDGLALSSRNAYLTSAMREKAPSVYEALTSATVDAGRTTAGEARKTATQLLENRGFDVQYVSVADPLEMDERADGDSISNSIVSVACLIRDGEVECRLIDNIVVPSAV